MSNIVMHDRQRRAERKGDAMRASFRATKRKVRAQGCSDLERLEGDAAATMQSGWNFASPVDINDPNEAEDGQSNFGFAETENEEEEE